MRSALGFNRILLLLCGEQTERAEAEAGELIWGLLSCNSPDERDY